MEGIASTSPTQWTRTWANSGSRGGGMPGVLQSLGSQRVGHDLVAEQQQGHLHVFQNICLETLLNYSDGFNIVHKFLYIFPRW